MGRKSSVSKLHPDVVAFIQRLLRDNRYSLDELYDAVREQFPALDNPPSRSALWRYRKGFEQVLAHHRQISQAASALVRELGEDFDDKSGALLAQAVTTLATNATLGQLEKDDAKIGDVLALARAAKAAQEARTLSLRERQALQAQARKQAADTAVKEVRAAGLSDDVAEAIRRKILGLS